jgi:hypothetical protein
MRGTPVTVTGSGFLPPELGKHSLTIKGPGMKVTVPLQYVDAFTLRYHVDDAVLNKIPPGTPAFNGTFKLVRTLYETGAADSTTIAVQLQVVDNLTPFASSFSTDGDVLYPGDEITVSGSGFLLPGEGQTILFLKGTFESLVPPETNGVQAAIPVTGDDRNTIRFQLSPDILGIRPGTFVGSMEIANEASASSISGTGLNSLIRVLKAPQINQIYPQVVSRGQVLSAVGRGFLATDAVVESTTLLRLAGEFTTSQTSEIIVLKGPTALALFPDAFQGNTLMEYVLRVSQDPSGEMEGLGLVAGGFNGVISPMIINGAETIVGTGVAVSLVVAPQRQIVFVHFLPGFTKTLEEMGLAAVELQVRERILTVCRRDYEGVNVEFRDIRPTDYAEYSIIEVSGADPNQAGLFGLDNTAGKDVGNLRFNDIIGGTNAETQEEGFYAFGGVFVRSFFQLSPSLFGSQMLPIGSARFDDIFGPFMPAMGGTPINPAELNGPRQYQIQEAIRVLGNLVGTTVTHEIGHSLGLANYDGQFHNPTDILNRIMDAGNFRPFEERAEIDGYGPAIFSEVNRTYLERTLPID